MYLVNNSPGPVWWGTYADNDVMRGIALGSGVLSARGGEDDWPDDTRPRVQLVLRRDNLLGPLIAGWTLDSTSHVTIARPHKDGVTLTVPDPSEPPKPRPHTTNLRVRNSSLVDVHVVTSWAGFVVRVKNDIAPGTEWVIGGPGPVDVTIIPGWKEDSRITAEERDAWNAKTVIDTALDTAGVVLAITGFGLTFAASSKLVTKLGIGFAKGVATASLGHSVYGVVAPDGVMPPGFEIKEVGGPGRRPHIVCRGGKTFGTVRGGQLHVEAASPVSATLWEVNGDGHRERRFPNDIEAWEFVPHMDSPGGDIGQVAGYGLETLKYRADRSTDVAAFNTNGWFKKSLAPRDQWVRWTDDPKKGMYVLAR